MRSLSELAETYEVLAAEIELRAGSIIDSFRQSSPDLRGKQAEQAIVLIHEARAYRRDAADLRGGLPALTLLPADQRYWRVR